MKPWKSIGPLLLLTAAAGCAATRPPTYFGSDARTLHENGADYWEGAARTAPYLQVRMRRRRQAPALEATVYAGRLDLRSIAPAVMTSTFTMPEGASASFHYDFNAGVAGELSRSGRASAYFPDALDVVVLCAQGKCWAESKPLDISPEGSVALTSSTIRGN